ncbi:MAG: response regulator transcription factor [Actinomycetota bacterium]|nr:response regulator transcription factor [Actinomycetota bacterium]
MSTDAPPPMLRVVVVEDHPMFRAGLVALLGDLNTIEVVGQAATGEQAVEVVAAGQPDVVLMDLHLPGMDGIETTALITAQQPTVAVLALTMLEDADTIVAAVQAGARGYLLKEATPTEIVHAVTAVAAGQAVFGGIAATRALAALATAEPATRPLPQLTEREAEILDLMARGLTNAAISERLFLSDKTVRNHVSNIFTKLGVSDRAAAVAQARDVGLGRSRR